MLSVCHSESSPASSSSPSLTRTSAPSPRRRLSVAGVLLLAGAALTLAGCSFSSVMKLSAGDCIELPQDSTAVTVDVRSCTSDHNAEVSKIVSVKDDGEFPGDAVLNERAEKECVDSFEDYVGTPYVTSALDVTWLIPTKNSWEQNDRSIVCLVHAMDRSALTQSVKDSQL
ncbi:septum formation family protein [Schaalia sp. ZJ405]|uniref:septum formation family protein n=1 Tax=unclassified Schaalia TaxID=2691889 RepID=UPI0013EBEA5D|nr:MULTISPECIES: septum formation family protein [unclassified Schaalia]QPK81096.1 septum formation family protein [Schaalia sp. ZJ405]